MSKINKIKVDNVIYDIEDAEARELIDSLQKDFDDIDLTDYATKGYVDEQISNIEASGGSDYELPIASSSTLGGIKVGANLSIDENGVLSASASGGSGSGGTTDIYSTAETKTNKVWYNGKPIYRKVFKMLTPETKGSFVVIPHDITNIAEITNRIAFFRASNLYYYADFCEDSSHRFLCVPSTADFSIFLGSALFSNADMTIILEYTKTTDETNS